MLPRSGDQQHLACFRSCSNRQGGEVEADTLNWHRETCSGLHLHHFRQFSFGQIWELNPEECDQFTWKHDHCRGCFQPGVVQCSRKFATQLIRLQPGGSVDGHNLIQLNRGTGRGSGCHNQLLAIPFDDKVLCHFDSFFHTAPMAAILNASGINTEPSSWYRFYPNTIIGTVYE